MNYSADAKGTTEILKLRCSSKYCATKAFLLPLQYDCFVLLVRFLFYTAVTFIPTRSKAPSLEVSSL